MSPPFDSIQSIAPLMMSNVNVSLDRRLVVVLRYWKTLASTETNAANEAAIFGNASAISVERLRYASRFSAAL